MTSNSTCACSLGVDPGLNISGSGTSGDPFVIAPDLNVAVDNLLTVDADGLYVEGYNQALGVLDTDKIEAQSTGATTTDVVVLTLAALTPVSANRWWKLWFHCPQVESTVALDEIIVSLKEGASEINRTVQTCSQANIESSGCSITHLVTPTVAAHTYTIAIRRSLTSTGTVAIGGDATHPSWLVCEDLGPV